MARVTPTGWDGAKYREIKIDHSLIDSDLSDFPIAIHGDATSVGKTSIDVSSIFDEIGANWQKIAIANEAGSQCYVEKVGWDTTGETLELWFKAPSVSSSSDSKYYLYYDNDHADNTTYVKAQGSATDVWDSNYKLVAHMNDLTTSTVEDSTGNSNDGAKGGASAPTATASGKIGSGQDFETNEYINWGANADFTPASLSIEVWIKTDNATTGRGNVSRGLAGGSAGGWSYVLRFVNDSVTWDGQNTDDAACFSTDGGAGSLTTDWMHVMGTFDGSVARLYKNGAQIAYDDTIVGVIGYAKTYTNFHCGKREINVPGGFDGKMDELRFSNVARSAAYAKASYNSGNDSLITFGSEETDGASTFIPRMITIL